MVKRFHFSRSKIDKSWLEQLAIGARRRINEMFKEWSMDMNRLSTRADLNIIHLCSYGFIIVMDWLDNHHVIIDCYNKAFTCLNKEGNLRTVQCIPREITIKEVTSLQLNKSLKKGCQIFASHMEETYVRVLTCT
jgi:hypothetical protein